MTEAMPDKGYELELVFPIRIEITRELIGIIQDNIRPPHRNSSCMWVSSDLA